MKEMNAPLHNVTYGDDVNELETYEIWMEPYLRETAVTIKVRILSSRSGVIREASILVVDPESGDCVMDEILTSVTRDSQDRMITIDRLLFNNHIHAPLLSQTGPWSYKTQATALATLVPPPPKFIQILSDNDNTLVVVKKDFILNDPCYGQVISHYHWDTYSIILMFDNAKLIFRLSTGDLLHGIHHGRMLCQNLLDEGLVKITIYAGLLQFFAESRLLGEIQFGGTFTSITTLTVNYVSVY